MDKNKKAEHKKEIGKLGVCDYELPKKNIWFVNQCGRFLVWRGEAPFRVCENCTRQVHFESHSPEWQILPKFNFQH